ncbi:SRPBCC family protein [Streptomyces sp. NPDC100445]|uniref:SRPBCC family protein n=1 Tax=Streptomyces sp. NPDC100445 TaxID=3366102 RepID=UPI003809068C
MARLTLRVAGAAAPRTVWHRYVYVDRWARWSPHIRAVRAGRRTMAPGLSGTVESVAGIRAVFVVDDVDARHRVWTWRVRCGPVRVVLRHDVRKHPKGSATRLTMRGPLPVLPAYAPIALPALRRLVRP